jgi:hypothetical protein
MAYRFDAYYQSMPFQDEVGEGADALCALANAGLLYDQEAHTREQNQNVLELSARLVAGLEGQSEYPILHAYAGSFSHMSPAAGVEVAKARCSLSLLIQRCDNCLWALPGAWSKLGKHPSRLLRGNFSRKLVHLFVSSSYWLSSTRDAGAAVYQVSVQPSHLFG